MEPGEDVPALLVGIKPFQRMDAVVDHRIFRFFQGKLILLRGHAELLFKGGGKIAVIGKTGGHAHGSELLLPSGDQLAGAVDPDGIHIFLEALI